MTVLETTQAVPLVRNDDGAVRFSGSRVALDSIVHQFKSGATAEQIQEDFPSLALRDIYSAIAYYLQHFESVEEYLRTQAAASGDARREMERVFDPTELRRRLRERDKAWLETRQRERAGLALQPSAR